MVKEEVQQEEGSGNCWRKCFKLILCIFLVLVAGAAAGNLLMSQIRASQDQPGWKFTKGFYLAGEYGISFTILICSFFGIFRIIEGSSTFFSRFLWLLVSLMMLGASALSIISISELPEFSKQKLDFTEMINSPEEFVSLFNNLGVHLFAIPAGLYLLIINAGTLLSLMTTILKSIFVILLLPVLGLASLSAGVTKEQKEATKDEVDEEKSVAEEVKPTHYQANLGLAWIESQPMDQSA
jgi:hypothetical protein